MVVGCFFKSREGTYFNFFITHKAKALMEKGNTLKIEVIKSEENAEMLMQAVLKEMFERKKRKEI